MRMKLITPCAVCVSSTFAGTLQCVPTTFAGTIVAEYRSAYVVESGRCCCPELRDTTPDDEILTSIHVI